MSEQSARGLNPTARTFVARTESPRLSIHTASAHPSSSAPAHSMAVVHEQPTLPIELIEKVFKDLRKHEMRKVDPHEHLILHSVTRAPDTTRMSREASLMISKKELLVGAQRGGIVRLKLLSKAAMISFLDRPSSMTHLKSMPEAQYTHARLYLGELRLVRFGSAGWHPQLRFCDKTIEVVRHLPHLVDLTLVVQVSSRSMQPNTRWPFIVLDEAALVKIGRVCSALGNLSRTLKVVRFRYDNGSTPCRPFCLPALHLDAMYSNIPQLSFEAYIMMDQEEPTAVESVGWRTWAMLRRFRLPNVVYCEVECGRPSTGHVLPGVALMSGLKELHLTFHRHGAPWQNDDPLTASSLHFLPTSLEVLSLYHTMPVDWQFLTRLKLQRLIYCFGQGLRMHELPDHTSISTMAPSLDYFTPFEIERTSVDGLHEMTIMTRSEGLRCLVYVNVEASLRNLFSLRFDNLTLLTLVGCVHHVHAAMQALKEGPAAPRLSTIELVMLYDEIRGWSHSPVRHLFLAIKYFLSLSPTLCIRIKAVDWAAMNYLQRCKAFELEKLKITPEDAGRISEKLILSAEHARYFKE